MDMEFPGDIQERTCVKDATSANASGGGRWRPALVSRVYGVSRAAAAGLLHGGARRACSCGAAYSGHCDTYDAARPEHRRHRQRHAPGAARGARGVNRRGKRRRSTSRSRMLYRFWRNLENLPRFMRHLESVERVTDTLSRWRAKGPAGVDVEWNAEIINEVPNQVIGWRSLEGSDVVSAGSVNFETSAQVATRVRVRLQYSPPGGKVGAAVAWLMGRDPATEIREDLQPVQAARRKRRGSQRLQWTRPGRRPARSEPWITVRCWPPPRGR